MGTSKWGGRGHERAGEPKVDCVAMVKVVASLVASPMAAARPEAMISLELRTSVVGGCTWP